MALVEITRNIKGGFLNVDLGGDMPNFFGHAPLVQTPTQYSFGATQTNGGWKPISSVVTLRGEGLGIILTDILVSSFSAGTITSLEQTVDGRVGYSITELSIDAVTLSDKVLAGDLGGVLGMFFGGDDTFRGANALRGDKLNSFAGQDRLLGRGGDDWLNGGTGRDTLNGGLGNDSFVFDSAGLANADLIRDFSEGDVIVLRQSAFAGLGPVGTLAEDAFHVGASAADAEDRIIFDSARGRLLYDPDGTGTLAARLIALFGGDSYYIITLENCIVAS